MQGWTPLHVALFPMTHIKDFEHGTWRYDEYEEDYIQDYDTYDEVRKEMISCIKFTCHLSNLCYEETPAAFSSPHELLLRASFICKPY